MRQVAAKQGADVQLRMIDKNLPKIKKSDSAAGLTGIFMPTHGFTAPWSVIKATLRLPRVRKTHAIVVATQGRLQFKKCFIPGLSGSATFLIALILMLKGYRIRGVQSINMPSNWMALHSGQKPANVQRIIENARVPSEHFIRKILAGQRSWFTFLNGIEFLLGLLLVPVSIGYLLYAKTALAKLFFVNRRCTGCGLCAEYCPNAAILMKGKNHKYPFWTFHCESCMRCMAFCPQKAIEVQQPSAFLVWKVVSLATFFTAFAYLRKLTGFDLPVHNKVVLRIWHYGYYLGVWYIFSKILFWISRIPIINCILNFTTLTVFYRRYREPDTNFQVVKGKVKF